MSEVDKIIEIKMGQWILRMPFDNDSIDVIHGFIDACFDERYGLKIQKHEGGVE